MRGDARSAVLAVAVGWALVAWTALRSPGRAVAPDPRRTAGALTVRRRRGIGSDPAGDSPSAREERAARRWASAAERSIRLRSRWRVDGPVSTPPSAPPSG